MERYSALSWKWGDRTRMAVIYIEGKIFEVRHNLFADLQQLRHPALTVRLWVDAICINQDDDSEKSVQIPLMPKIYGLAHSVCVWLGEAANDSHLAMVFLGRVAKMWISYHSVPITPMRCCPSSSFSRGDGSAAGGWSRRLPWPEGPSSIAGKISPAGIRSWLLWDSSRKPPRGTAPFSEC